MQAVLLHPTWPAARVSPLLAALVLAPLAASGLVDLPRMLAAGPLSGLGAITIGLLLLAGLGLVLLGSYPRQLAVALLPYAAFLGWMTLRSAITPPPFAGVQNGLVYALFGCELALVGTLAARHPRAVERLLAKGVRVVDYLALALVCVSIARNGVRASDELWLVGPRSVALTAIVPISWHLATWFSGRGGGGRLALWLGAVVISLSRTAMAVAAVDIAVVLALQAVLAPTRFVRRTPLMLLGALAVGAVALAAFDPLQTRFTDEYNRIEIGGVSVGTSGRNHMWPVVIASAQEQPLVGHGLGSSQVAVDVFDGTVSQPHNDYLRLWHDLGVAGVASFVLALVAWLVALGRAAWRSSRLGREGAAVELAAFLALLAFALAAITDNAVIYAFVMAPLGTLVGAGLGLRAYAARQTPLAPRRLVRARR